MPSVLLHCWLDDRKGIRPVKMVRYWHSYLSGTRWKWFAYGPADAIATQSYSYLEKKLLNGCSSSSSSVWMLGYWHCGAGYSFPQEFSGGWRKDKASRWSFMIGISAWQCIDTQEWKEGHLAFRTSSSAIAEGPRDALSQLKSCQLLHNCMKNHIWLDGLPFHVV